MRICRLLPVVAIAAVLLVSTTGCSPTSSWTLRADASPELFSTTRSFEQHWNNQSHVMDYNYRSGWDDLNRIFLLEKPTGLSPYPVP